MKKIFSFALLAATSLGFTACVNEEDDLFSESAAERLNAAESRYSDIFTASPAGWSMEYYPTNDTLGFKAKGYLLLADFKKDGSVRVGMNNVFSDYVYKEDQSLWDIITDNGPVLSFNTYNECLHAFSDPHDLSAVIQGVSADDADNLTGLGAEGDYEFVLTNVKADEDVVTIKGKKRGTYVRMVKLEDGTDFETFLSGVVNFQNSYFPATAINDAYLTVGGRKYVLTDVSSGIISLYPADGDPITDTKIYSFIFNNIKGQYHLRFRKPVVEGEAAVQELAYDESLGHFVDADGGDATLEGPNANTFFGEWLERKTWTFVQNTATMSEDVKAVYDDFVTALANSSRKYSVNDIVFSTKGETTILTINIQYRQNGKTNRVALNYSFSVAADEDHVALAYGEPQETASSNILSTIPAVSVFLQKLSNTFTVSPANNPFVMNKLNLISGETQFQVESK